MVRSGSGEVRGLFDQGVGLVGVMGRGSGGQGVGLVGVMG